MLEDLKSDIAKLVALYEVEKQRADSLEAELSQSKEMNSKYKEQIADLNQQIETVKLMNAFSAAGDTAMAKERVTKLIREIDRCIKLLEN